MKAFDIEVWARRVIDRTVEGRPDEDSRVELKTDWPEPGKTARRLAGHANVARGEPILWLVGVNQKGRTVPGVDQLDVASWYAQVQSEFDEQVAPELQDLNFVYDNKTVVALLFETDRFPFVIKGANGVLEVPWREGTRTRSARRSDLFKLLIPLQLQPRLEVLSGHVSLEQRREKNRRWIANLDYYIEPQANSLLVIPFHRCYAKLLVVEQNYSIPLMDDLRLSVPGFGGILGEEWHPGSRTIEGTRDELVVHGPGRIRFFASGEEVHTGSNYGSGLEVDVRFLVVGSENPVLITAKLVAAERPTADEDVLHYWKYLA